MSAPTIKFDDGAVYERMMGKWSGLAGRAFIEWLSPPPKLRWIATDCECHWLRLPYPGDDCRSPNFLRRPLESHFRYTTRKLRSDL